MTVKPKTKQKVAKQVEKWKQHLLEKYHPTGDLANLDLDGCTVTLRELKMPAITTGIRKIGRMTGFVLSRPDHIEETYCLIMKHPVIWDAETLDAMVMVNNEFTIFDKNGEYFNTSMLLSMLGCSYGEYASRIETSNDHTYLVDSYRGICSMDGQKPRNARESAPFVEVLNTRPTVVIRTQSGPKWYAAKWGVQDLQLVDEEGQLVLDLGHIRMWRRLSILFMGIRGPGKLHVSFRSVAPEVPNELALFMAASTIM